MNGAGVEYMITVDTREPDPSPWADQFTAPTIRATLQTGDYSIAGCERLITVERKALGDLIGCLTTSRARFERELTRMQAIPYRYVIVESEWRYLMSGKFRSAMTPAAASESVCAFMQRYQVPFLFAGSAELAGRLCNSLLHKFVREWAKTVMAISEAATA